MEHEPTGPPAHAAPGAQGNRVVGAALALLTCGACLGSLAVLVVAATWLRVLLLVLTAAVLVTAGVLLGTATAGRRAAPGGPALRPRDPGSADER